jgi:hypothetical protein
MGIARKARGPHSCGTRMTPSLDLLGRRCLTANGTWLHTLAAPLHPCCIGHWRLVLTKSLAHTTRYNHTHQRHRCRTLDWPVTQRHAALHVACTNADSSTADVHRHSGRVPCSLRTGDISLASTAFAIHRSMDFPAELNSGVDLCVLLRCAH